jgi:hypothetical protein
MYLSLDGDCGGGALPQRSRASDSDSAGYPFIIVGMASGKRTFRNDSAGSGARAHDRDSCARGGVAGFVVSDQQATRRALVATRARILNRVVVRYTRR